MILRDMLEEKGFEVNRENPHKISREVHEEQGQRWIGRKVIERIDNLDAIVIDGTHFLEDTAYLTVEFERLYEKVDDVLGEL